MGLFRDLLLDLGAELTDLLPNGTAFGQLAGKHVSCRAEEALRRLSRALHLGEQLRGELLRNRRKAGALSHDRFDGLDQQFADEFAPALEGEPDGRLEQRLVLAPKEHLLRPAKESLLRYQTGE